MMKHVNNLRYVPHTLLDYFAFLKEFNEKDTIIIAGTPRSGTTWLMELLYNLNDYISLFEPLHAEWFPDAKKLKNITRPYIRYNENDQEFYNYFNNIFNGRIKKINRSVYNFKLNNILKRLNGNKLLIKFVRANRILPWISNNFNLKKIFLLTRHPCGNISSQMETGIRGYYMPKEKIPFQAIDDILQIDKIDKNIKNSLRSIKYHEEVLAAIWAVDHYIPLSLDKVSKWKLIRYEDLIINGEYEIENILKELKSINNLDKIIAHLKKPSRTTPKSELKKIDNNNRQIYKWKNKLSDIQIKRIRNILELFDITFSDDEYFFNFIH